MMLTALIICLTDWCIAATHMAYTKSERMPSGRRDAVRLLRLSGMDKLGHGLAILCGYRRP